MSRQTLNAPASPYAGPSLRDTTPEGGDNYKALVEKAEANFAELYGLVGNATAAEIAVLAGAVPGAGAASKALVLDENGNVVMPAGGQLKFSLAVVAAAGSTSADAAALAAQVSVVTGADGATGVALPAAAANEARYVLNASLTENLKVYPVDGGNDQINGLAEDAAFILAPGKGTWFYATSATQWRVPDTVAGEANGAVAGSGVAVTSHKVDGGLHKMVLALTDAPITLTDDPGVAQYGSIKLFDFPAGAIHALGAVIDADLTLNETWWVDTIAGDVGLGSAAVADGDALAGAEQNVIATSQVAALVAQAGPINAQSGASATLAAAGAADADLHLNLRIDDDAVHMPDQVTNGAFGADTDWTKGDGWSIAGGVADCDGSQAAVSDLSQAIAGLIEGVTYRLTFTMTRSAGSLTPIVGGTAGTTRSTADTFVENIVAGADGTLLFRADADFVGTLDNVSLTPLTGTGTITGTVTVVWATLGDF